jgi:O-antigen/teichoic acid export membrane protein
MLARPVTRTNLGWSGALIVRTQGLKVSAPGEPENAPTESAVWGPPDHPLELFARNVSTRYVAIFIDGAIGVVLLPFNIAHLGPSAYGLWALTVSVTWFFGVLDLGYGGALVKFIARYRALRDRTALNEIVSTIGLLFSLLGVVTLLITAVIAWRFNAFFNVEPEQVRTGQRVLLIVGVYLSVQFAFSVFGAVVYGFQRYYRNNIVSIGTSLMVAVVNVLVFNTGHGLVTLVASTTAVRLLSLLVFAWNARRVFPGLQIRSTLFRVARLREVTGFSIYMAVLDWSAKLNYSSDAIVIGAMLDTTAVAVWTVGQRLAQLAQRLTNQVNDALFPLVVDSDAMERPERLQAILLQSTKLSLALAVPLCVGLIVLAGPLVQRWVGARFSGSVLPLQLMIAVVLVRSGTASANLILKGAGRHQLLTVANATTAIINVLLSVALVRPLGLVGVALGTLIPVAGSAVFVLYPAACRRVDVSVWRPLIHAFWPALWPAVIMIAVLWPGRQSTNLLEVAIWLAVGALTYLGLFLGVALNRLERQFYWTKLRHLLGHQPRVAVSA